VRRRSLVAQGLPSGLAVFPACPRGFLAAVENSGYFAFGAVRARAPEKIRRAGGRALRYVPFRFPQGFLP